MNRIIIASARKVSAAEFHKLFEPRKSELTVLCERLQAAAWAGNREECAAIHKQIKALSLTNVHRDTDPETGNERVAA